MKTARTLENNILTLSIDGNLDSVTTPAVAEEIEADIDFADKIIIDMKDLKYISSAGLRLLLSLHKRMASKNGLVLKNVNQTNMELFEFTGFKNLLNIE